MKKRRKKRDRVYLRNGRAWGDFRDFRDVGGDREPLVVEGERWATADPDVASVLVAARLKQLEQARRDRGIQGRTAIALAEYVQHHLIQKKRARKVTGDWLDMAYLYLKRATAYFGMDRPLTSITVEDVNGWVTHLGSTRWVAEGSKPGAKGRALSSGTVRHCLNSLSNLYRRAQSEGKVPVGYNPVASMLEKPSGAKREARWLEVPDGALLLEAARTLPPSRGTRLDAEAVARLRKDWDQGGRSKRELAKSYGVSDVVVGRILRGQNASDPVDDAALAYPLLATFLLTGARSAEVLGLEMDDVSFDRKTITFRVNDWRRLKTLSSNRVVPLWPQLVEILGAYMLHRPPSRLLFPSFITGRESMIQEWRGTLDRVAARAGWKRGEIRSKMFRHTYCAARLQTLDGGHPVSPYTVSRELGHGSLKMVENVYSHLGTIRHRSDAVEYRIEQHRDALAEKLALLG